MSQFAVKKASKCSLTLKVSALLINEKNGKEIFSATGSEKVQIIIRLTALIKIRLGTVAKKNAFPLKSGL